MLQTDAPGSEIFRRFSASQNELHISEICRLTSNRGGLKAAPPRRDGPDDRVRSGEGSQPASVFHRRFVKVRATRFFEREINWMGRAAETLKKAVDFKTGWFKSRPPRRDGPDDRVRNGEGSQPASVFHRRFIKVRATRFFEREINWMGRAAETLKKAVDFKTGWFKSRPPRRGGPDDRVRNGEGGQPASELT